MTSILDEIRFTPGRACEIDLASLLRAIERGDLFFEAIPSRIVRGERDGETVIESVTFEAITITRK